MRNQLPTYETIKFNDVAQTMTRFKVGKALVAVLMEEDRLIAKLPNGVVFVGDGDDDLSQKVIRRLDAVDRDDKDALSRSLQQYRPSHNSISFDFAKDIVVTRKVVDRFIEIHNQRFVIWSGEVWRTAHTDLPEMLLPHGVVLGRSRTTQQSSGCGGERPPVRSGTGTSPNDAWSPSSFSRGGFN